MSRQKILRLVAVVVLFAISAVLVWQNSPGVSAQKSSKQSLSWDGPEEDQILLNAARINVKSEEAQKAAATTEKF
jgi:hypothetical protein